MTTAPCQSKTSSFFYLLQTTPGLDKRDNRGKIHDMAFVITGLTLAICCGRDGGLSRLHRHIGNHFTPLCLATQTWPKRVISRAQLPLLLAKVDGEVFGRLLFEWFGLVLSEEAKRWFTFDGKELRAGRPEPQYPARPQARRGMRFGPGPRLGTNRGPDLLQRWEGKRAASRTPTVE